MCDIIPMSDIVPIKNKIRYIKENKEKVRKIKTFEKLLYKGQDVSII